MIENKVTEFKREYIDDIKYGTGILKINENYADISVKPQIEATNNAFKITLPNTCDNKMCV